MSLSNANPVAIPTISIKAQSACRRQLLGPFSVVNIDVRKREVLVFSFFWSETAVRIRVLAATATTWALLSGAAEYPYPD